MLTLHISVVKFSFRVLDMLSGNSDMKLFIGGSLCNFFGGLKLLAIAASVKLQMQPVVQCMTYVSCKDSFK